VKIIKAAKSDLFSITRDEKSPPIRVELPEEASRCCKQIEMSPSSGK
jgi:hypothetical protein